MLCCQTHTGAPILLNASSVVRWAMQMLLKQGIMTSVNMLLLVNLFFFLILPFNPTIFLTWYLYHSLPSPTWQSFYHPFFPKFCLDQV